MRVLLTAHQFFPAYKAGTEILTLSVAKELSRHGHEVRVFTGHLGDESLEESDRYDEYEYEGIHVYRFHHAYTPMAGQTSLIEVGYKNELALRFFREIVEEFKPDLVHYFHLNRLGIGLINYLADQAVPQYFTPTDFWMICPTAQLMLGEGEFCEGPDAEAGNCIKHFADNSIGGFAGGLVNHIPTWIVKQLARITKNNPIIQYPMSQEVRALSTRVSQTVLAMNKLDGIIAPNAFMKQLFIRYGVNLDLISESPFGIDLNFDDKTARVINYQSPLNVGYIGTLAPHKGCHVVIEAFNKLPAGLAILYIYGDSTEFPDYYHKLISLADNNKDIHFCGTFPNAQINSVMSALDVLVVPSIWYENTPLVLYSAQAAKCPVIASDLPGISIVIKNGINGFLFEPGNINALSEHLKSISSNRELIKTLGDSCKDPLSIKEYVNYLLDRWGQSK
ncbi:glycosyltransferase [Sodalis ligni]|uniref:glycosyltransferase n=1 Tax=Sodalis ligni TaxID=2697027 RepID=UPI001BDF6353|nr:glycosyltransferase [Sodalis ligni]QWA09351.1 glycosyltransferase [Sodalis ligni]